MEAGHIPPPPPAPSVPVADGAGSQASRRPGEEHNIDFCECLALLMKGARCSSQLRGLAMNGPGVPRWLQADFAWSDHRTVAIP